MFSFGTYFFICNLFISGIIVCLLLAKKALQKQLSGRRQYQVWFLLPAVLSVPFFPVRPTGIDRILSRLMRLKAACTEASKVPQSASIPASGWVSDFSISITREAPSMTSWVPFAIWISGILVMLVWMLRSKIRLHHLEKSALPVQSKDVRALFSRCTLETKIRRRIPVYSTAFLKSPVIVGWLKPRIYVPIHLISDFHPDEMRYMFLHELQHYKHRDALMNHLLNLAVILYWFNPFVWYAVGEARSDREIACDTSVLQMLDSKEYAAYGNTLLNFARKISRPPFSLASGIGGNTKQIRKRIRNIAFYRPQKKRQKFLERALFFLLAVLVLESTAWIPVLASEEKGFLPADTDIIPEDLSSYFSGYDGCFVLYDLRADTWTVYNEAHAAQRFSPDSTYKIYSALSALENEIITPDASFRKWDGQIYPIPRWNQNQTLASALQDSVNWYFQSLDQAAGRDALKRFYERIGYGNQNLSGDLSGFWLESSLKISALEQAELLKKLYTNEFHFEEQNLQAVRQALLIASDGTASLYGKTGTGNINGQNINGWFIGYEETGGNTYFFASNIQGPSGADGLTAANITRRILKDKHLLRL